MLAGAREVGEKWEGVGQVCPWQTDGPTDTEGPAPQRAVFCFQGPCRGAPAGQPPPKAKWAGVGRDW